MHTLKESIPPLVAQRDDIVKELKKKGIRRARSRGAEPFCSASLHRCWTFGLAALDRGWCAFAAPAVKPLPEETYSKQLLVLDEIQAEVDLFIGAYLKQGLFYADCGTF